MANPLALGVYAVLIVAAALAVWRRHGLALYTFVVGLAVHNAVLAALYLVQEQQGYITASAMRHVAEFLRITPAEVEDAATYYVMFFKAPVGKYVLQVCRTLSCAPPT